ncbi:hypothetical protein ANO11243_015740 [Dothideomycetidae sp. 11243]|nr:hypothetical protein ANO11243_015740 [fungal sp. No.11243]
MKITTVALTALLSSVATAKVVHMERVQPLNMNFGADVHIVQQYIGNVTIIRQNETVENSTLPPRIDMQDLGWGKRLMCVSDSCGSPGTYNATGEAINSDCIERSFRCADREDFLRLAEILRKFASCRHKSKCFKHSARALTSIITFLAWTARPDAGQIPQF